ncbi:MAG: DUF2877 domain-containing protein [Anaerolineae bacterium]|nr:DUF2877 domain-containing protein [Anaerolineae bacterium]
MQGEKGTARLLPARSIARPVRSLLAAWPFEARVLAVFERACLLSTPDGEVLSLVLPAAGDGPLNVVVEGEPGAFGGLAQAMRAHLHDGQLSLGDVRVPLAGAATWEPRPAWERLRAAGATAPLRLEQLRAVALAHAPREGLLVLLAPEGGSGSSARPPAEVERARAAAADLAAGRAGDVTHLEAGARRLAGLGGGLTPAGDDFLVGAMLRAWLDGPAPDAFCRAVTAVAAPRTTLLSAALLRAAARGECSAPWHRLLAALESGASPAPAVEAILAHGHTSGADALAGFLGAN